MVTDEEKEKWKADFKKVVFNNIKRVQGKKITPLMVEEIKEVVRDSLDEFVMTLTEDDSVRLMGCLNLSFIESQNK